MLYSSLQTSREILPEKTNVHSFVVVSSLFFDSSRKETKEEAEMGVQKQKKDARKENSKKKAFVIWERMLPF